MFSGVQTHGVLHRLRMEDVFWTKTMTIIKAVELFMVTAMPQGVDQQRIDRIMSVYRELTDILLPHQAEIRKQREDNLRSMMSTPEFLRPMEVLRVREG